MSTLVTIGANDLITNSRADINGNFAALNTDKIETSVLDTDGTLAANSDAKIATQKAIRTYIASLGSLAFVPVGGQIPYAGSSAPTGWLLCDGSAVSRSTYAALFAIAGTAYGVGDGSTTFNLPDKRGRVSVGAGTGTKVATFASRSSNVITVTGPTNKANNEFQTGQAVLYHTTGSVITGLTDNTTYYVVRTGNLTFSLATTLANAQNSVVISLSSDGTGTQTFTQTLSVRAVGESGGEENHAMSATELLSHTHAADTFSGTGSGTVGSSGVAHGTNGTPTAGGNAAMNSMMPYNVDNWIIKA